MTTEHTPPPVPKKTKRTPWIISIAAFLVLALGGGTWAVSANNAKQLAEANEAWTAATGAHSSLVIEANEAIIQAQPVLDDSEGKVADNQVREDLTIAITTVENLAVSKLPSPDREDKADLEEATTHTVTATDELTLAITALTKAQEDVTAAVQAWELAQALEAHTTAKTTLTTAITNAEQTVKDLTGKVADNKTVEALTKAIADARLVLEAKVDETTAETVAVGTAALVKGTETVGNASKAVTDSNAAWIKAEEAKRAAASKAATPAAKKPAAGNQSSSSSSKKSTTNQGNKQVTPKQSNSKKPAAQKPAAKKPAAKKPAPKPSKPKAPSGGGWVQEEVPQGSVCWKLDTKGNSVKVPC